jgi:hypothetical protein
MPCFDHRHNSGVFLYAFDLPASRSRGRAVALPLMATLKVSLYRSLRLLDGIRGVARSRPHPS